MTNDKDLQEFLEFKATLSAAKAKGHHTERETLEKLIVLCAKNNRYALASIKSSGRALGPESMTSSSAWTLGELLELQNAAVEPLPTNKGTDYSGLWRKDEANVSKKAHLRQLYLQHGLPTDWIDKML